MVDVDAECSAGGCPSSAVRLRDTLVDWTDWDVAAFRLGRAIGLYERNDEYQRAKGTFWTDNPVGRSLHEALVGLADAGILEQRDEPDIQFRWARPTDR